MAAYFNNEISKKLLVNKFNMLMTKVPIRHTMNHIDLSLFRSRHRWCSVEKGVPKNFANFTGKHLRWSLFVIKTFLPKKKHFYRRYNTFFQYMSAFALAIGTSWRELQRLYIYSI